MEKLITTLALVGATLAIFAGACVGALIAFTVSTQPLLTRVGTFLCGLLLGIVGAPAVGAWLNVNANVWAGIALLLGAFGMAIAGEGTTVIKDGTIRNILLNLLQRKGP